MSYSKWIWYDFEEDVLASFGFKVEFDHELLKFGQADASPKLTNQMLNPSITLFVTVYSLFVKTDTVLINFLMI